MRYSRKKDKCICVSKTGTQACIGKNIKIQNINDVYILDNILDESPKTIEGIASEAQKHFPSISKEEITMFLDLLAEEDLIERH